MPPLFYWAMAALSGAAMALQGTFNAAMGKVIGVWQSTLAVHIIGAAATFLIMMLWGMNWSNYGKLGELPWYAWLGGILNVLIIFAVVTVMPKIGVGNATTAIVVAQIMTAVTIDALGAFGMEQYRFRLLDLLGIALLAGGTWILTMK
ncbi:MAG: DMT family transporter [Syntrophomonadaceae bacterium]|nr:DMT family transporter [Syntrophomonadaceae bacterium]